MSANRQHRHPKFVISTLKVSGLLTQQVMETATVLVELISKEQILKMEVIKELHHIADELDVKHRDMRIAKTSFGAVGIVSSALTIAGIAASPFTFGASLGLTIAGTVLGVSCGAGGAATHIAGMVIEKKTMEKAQQKMDEYRDLVVELDKCVETVKGLAPKELETAFRKLRLTSSDEQSDIFNRIIDSLRVDQDTLKPDLTSGLLSGTRVTSSASHVGVSVAKTVGEVVEGSVKAVKIGGMVLSVLTVPLDIYSIVNNSIKIHRNSPSKTSEEIRRLAKFLKNIAVRQDRERALFTLYEAALKYDPANTILTKLKLFHILLQVFGIISITISVFFRSIYLFLFIVLVIVMDISGLILEMCIKANTSAMWPNVKQELNDIINQTCRGGSVRCECSISTVINLFHEFKQNIEHVDSIRDYVLIALKSILDCFGICYVFNMGTCITDLAEVVTGMITLEGTLALTEAATEAPQCLNPYRALVFLLTSPLCLFILVEMVGETFMGKKSRFREHTDNVLEDARIKMARVHDAEDNERRNM